MVRIFCFSLGRDRSCPVSTVHRGNLSTHSFCSSTHHDGLECQPITKFFITNLLLLFKSFVFHFFYFDLLLPLCSVMLAASSSLSLTPLTYLGGRLGLFLLILALFSCRSSVVILYLSSSGVHLSRSFAVLIHVLLIWLLLSSKLSVSFEKFVYVVFPSFSWSPNRSVDPVF